MLGVATSLSKFSPILFSKAFLHTSLVRSVVATKNSDSALLTYTNFNRNLPSLLENIDFEKIEFLRTDSDQIIVFTDGSCIHNHCNEDKRRSGIGVFWGFDDHPLNVSMPMGGNRLTSNRAEIAAVHVAILVAKYLKIPRLCLFTDSAYVTKSCQQWLPLWKVNNWRLTSSKKSVANIDMWKKIAEDLEFVLVNFQNCSRQTEGVKKAHELAKIGSRVLE